MRLIPAFKNQDKAKEFLDEYGFVVYDLSDDVAFATQCANVAALANTQQPAGHANYSFLKRRPQGSHVFAPECEAAKKILDVFENEVHDFYPDAHCHDQASWDLRCNDQLRQFFAKVHRCDADALLPSIEPIAAIGGDVCTVDETETSEPEIGRRPDACCLSVPTFHSNATWIRAPDVIGAYHLDAYVDTMKKHWNDYLSANRKQSSATNMFRHTQDGVDMREQHRWLQRVQKELAATAGKVILGKRSTNKMVRDAGIASKRAGASTPAKKTQNGVGDAAGAVGAMRNLDSGFEAMVFVGAQPNTTTSQTTIHLVPQFERFMPYFLAQKYQKWAQCSGDCVKLHPLEDSLSIACFRACAVQAVLKPGQVLVMRRSAPRWIEAADKNLKQYYMPVTYRVQEDHSNQLSAIVGKKENGNNVDIAVAAGQICPFNLALLAAYKMSIANGIVYTCLPHLTGSPHFARSTKKAAVELARQRDAAFGKWKSSLTNVEQWQLDVHHYKTPQLPTYLEKLICWPDADVKTLDAVIDKAAADAELFASTGNSDVTAAMAKVATLKPPPIMKMSTKSVGRRKRAAKRKTREQANDGISTRSQTQNRKRRLRNDDAPDDDDSMCANGLKRCFVEMGDKQSFDSTDDCRVLCEKPIRKCSLDEDSLLTAKHADDVDTDWLQSNAEAHYTNAISSL